MAKPTIANMTRLKCPNCGAALSPVPPSVARTGPVLKRSCWRCKHPWIVTIALEGQTPTYQRPGATTSGPASSPGPSRVDERDLIEVLPEDSGWVVLLAYSDTDDRWYFTRNETTTMNGLRAAVFATPDEASKFRSRLHKSWAAYGDAVVKSTDELRRRS